MDRKIISKQEITAKQYEIALINTIITHYKEERQKSKAPTFAL